MALGHWTRTKGKRKKGGEQTEGFVFIDCIVFLYYSLILTILFALQSHCNISKA